MTDAPLLGVRVLEFAALGPAPFAAMMLADLGADVLCVRRPGASDHLGGLSRGRPSIEVDLKSTEAVADLLNLMPHADVVIEGYRPGVMERRGLGPQECITRNPQLVYARMTGWGQQGARAHTAGHDLTYLAVSGALHLATRRGQAPVAPANVLGDFGGGSMMLVSSVLAALIAAQRTGVGRVLDIAITDSVQYLMSMIYSMHAHGMWSDEAGANLLDTGCPFYDVYECADGGWLAVAPLEPQFFAETVHLLGIDESFITRRNDREEWPSLRMAIADAVRTRKRDEWNELARNTDACIAPVLTLSESQRECPDLFTDGVPRLAWGTPSVTSSASDALERWGVSDAERLFVS